MFKKITIAAVITAGVGIGVLEYSKAIEIEEAHKTAKIAEARKAEEIVAAQEKYDTFTGNPMPEEIGEGFFSRTKGDLTKVRVANISSRGEVFRIAHDQDGYREVISRTSYAGNTIVQPEARWANEDRTSTLYMAFKLHCIDSYIQYMEEEKYMPQDNFKVKEVFIGGSSGYSPTEEDRSMSSNMTLMVAYGKYAWGNYSTREYAVKLKCAMDAARKIRWQTEGY